MLSYQDRQPLGNIKPARFGQWIKAIRGAETELEREEYLECLWASQLISKDWLVTTIKQIQFSPHVIIFGGWYGSLANILLDNGITNKVTTVDIDPNCAKYGPAFVNDDRIMFVTANMATYDYGEIERDRFIAPTVINTSTEHVSQAIYDAWLIRALDKASTIVIQGTNYKYETHARRFENLQDFEFLNRCIGLGKQLRADNLDRYMAIIQPQSY